MSTALAIDPVGRPLGPAARPFAAPPAPTVAAPGTAAAALPVARPKVLAGAALVAAAAVVAVAQLLLSVGTADDAYRLSALQQRSDALAREQQVQQEALRADAAPQRLAARAAALGMVPDADPAWLDVRTGRVLGDPSPAKGTAAKPGGIRG